MNKTYQGIVTLRAEGLHRRAFLAKAERLEAIVHDNPSTADAVIVSSARDRHIKLIVAIDAASSSAANSKIDVLMRGFMYKLDPSSVIKGTTVTVPRRVRVRVPDVSTPDFSFDRQLVPA